MKPNITKKDLSFLDEVKQVFEQQEHTKAYINKDETLIAFRRELAANDYDDIDIYRLDSFVGRFKEQAYRTGWHDS